MKPASVRGIVIAAPSSGSGKTLVTLGLLRALVNAGHNVGSAKAGPDYIDPRFHEAATGRACVNLDPWAMRAELIAALTAEAGQGCKLLIVEGVMGLFDGAETGEGSTADLAGLLGFPIILVIDALRQSHSIAALVRGFASHRRDCRVGGIIFNKVASQRHESILRSAVEPLDIPVLGCVKNLHELEVPSRHLGLVQAGEHERLESFIKNAAGMVSESVDMEALMVMADGAGAPEGSSAELPPLGQRIAVASDRAFAFAYPHLLGGWRRAGAELVPFSPLEDHAPDADADAVFLPGGYPELHAARLAANKGFLNGLRDAADRGALIYGECGGFMVLGKRLVDAGGESHVMAGLLPVATSFEERKLHLGYRELECRGALPFPKSLRGHEFHYSTLLSQADCEPLFLARDSAQRDLGAMGLQVGNVMGSFAHVIDAGGSA